MTGRDIAGRIDQMFFGWNLRAHSVLAHSFDDPGESDRWLYYLKSHLRLQRMGQAPVPETALTYLTFPDGMAVVLRRVSGGVNAGRNYSHAVIAPGELLTPQAALGLSLAPGWLAKPPQGDVLGTLPGTRLADEARQAEEGLRPVVAANGATLVLILAAMLADPYRPISVIGCPEDLKTAMIWGLIEIAGHGRRRLPDPSFSTYETDGGNLEKMPNILFLPALPFDQPEKPRTIVDLDFPAAGGRDLDRAQQQYQRLLSGDWPAPAEELVVHREEPQPARASVAAPAPASMTPPTPTPTPSSLSVEEAQVAQLRKARTLHDFDRALTDLSRLSPEQRRLVRAAMKPEAFAAVALRVEVDLREAVLFRLAEAVYGQGLVDLDDPHVQQHAVEVVDEGVSEQLALIIGSAKRARGQLQTAAFQRWAAETRKKPSEPAARFRRRIRDSRRGRYLPLVAAVAVVAVLGVAFLSGLIVGGRVDGPVSAAASQPAPLTVVPAGAGRIAGGVATVPGVDPSQITVIAFSTAADGMLQPQGPCFAGYGNRWFCPSRGDLPADQNVELVAYAVPNDQFEAALAGPPDPRILAGWGKPYPVR